MRGESENESSATVKAVEWIRLFNVAIGDLAPDIRSKLVGLKVSVAIDVDGMRYSYPYDPSTTVPALAAEHFRRHVEQSRGERGANS